MADTSAVARAAKSITSTLITEAKYLYGVEDRVRALQSDFECMQEFLQNVDANPNLLKQDGQLRILTLKMRDLAFRAEDAIDTYLVDVRFKTYNKNFLLKVVCLASNSFPMHMLRNKIEEIQQEIQVAMSRSEKYKMSISSTMQSPQSSSNPIAENYLHLDEFFVGIGDDITQLVKKIINLEEDFNVLGIVGTGGAGKTTLASKIFHHNKVQSSFSHRAFVSVSQQWSKLDLLNCISKEVMGHSKTSSSDETELIRELHDFMKDKQCLVVLDDIWKKEAWDDIYPIFPHIKGFRAILTTRIEEIPLYADKKCICHEPKLLTDDEMWALFSKGAVEGRHGIENNSEFEKLGKQMLQKCHGLPLAVVTLAGILRTKQHLNEWERINVVCANNILKEKGGFTYGVVEEMLELSYLELPTHLKPLFLYLSIIPEDVNFSTEGLIRMCIAEGFVTDDKETRFEILEEKAMVFLDELARRFIFRVTQRDFANQIRRIRLHDLMREFCIKKAGECHFFENVTTSEGSSKTRRVAIFSREYCPEENCYLRTIIYDSMSGRSSKGVTRKLESFHKHFKLLRVLSISHCVNDVLPKELGNLIHLTYLLLNNTRIDKLPESIRKLRNLMFFIYRSGIKDREYELPNDLAENMKNLRVLVLPDKLKRGSNKCNNSLGISSKKLHTLKSGAGRWMTKDLLTIELPIIRHLRFNNVEEIEELEAVYGCLTLWKDSLHTFRCWCKNKLIFDVQKVRDCKSLWSLNLEGRLLSIWFPPTLVYLNLIANSITEGVDLMEVVGHLPKLEYLCLKDNAYTGTHLSCNGDAFPHSENCDWRVLIIWKSGEWKEML